MNTKEPTTPTASHAGAEVDAQAGCEAPSVYSKCAECPVYAYRDAVCNDNLQALIRSGTPSEEELVAARATLVTEFAELTGNLHLKMANMALLRTLSLRLQIMALSAAIIASDRPHAIELFRRSGWGHLPTEQQLKRAEARIKELSVRLDKENAARTKRQQAHPDSLTEADFNMQLVMVSKWAGFHLSDRIMLAELAGYLKAYSEQLKIEQKHARSLKRH